MPEEGECEEMIARNDIDGSGHMDFGEFVQMMSCAIDQHQPQEEFMKAFRVFDDDATGKISFQNLKRYTDEIGEKMSDFEIRQMIELADRDGDHEISEDEFMRIMKKKLKD